jgi:hypothetical protein
MAPSYLEWNELIFKKVFNEENAGRAVSVFVDGQLLNEWAEELGAGKLTGEQGSIMFAKVCKDFISGRPDTVAKRIASMSKSWKAAGFSIDQPPNFIGLLALLVLASSWGGTRHQANKYYGRYWEMMGDADEDAMISDIYEVRHAWSALEEWTQSNEGALGVFKVRTLAPAFKNYGVIIAQGLLRPSDEMELRTLFYDFGAERDLDYPDTTLLAWFGERRGRFSPRAQAAYDSEANRDLFLERIRQELEMWDGEPADIGDLVGRSRSLKKQAFLCLTSKPEPGFTIRVDLSSRDGDPDVLGYRDANGESINLKAPSDGSTISLNLKQTFINDGITAQKPDQVFCIKNAASLSHFLASSFASTRQGSSDTYKPAGGDLKVLAKLPSVSMTDYVEVTTLRRNVKHVFMVNIHHPELPRIEAWARRFIDPSSDSEKYHPAFIRQTKWKLFFVGDNVREIEGAGIPQLRFERKKIVRLTGGLRFFGSGNKYLKSAIPRLVFETIYPVQMRLGKTVLDITDTSKELDLTDLLLPGQNTIELTEVTPEGINPETAEITLSLHEHAEWAPQGEGRWNYATDGLTYSASPVTLIGCKTGEILPIANYEDISATWSLHVAASGHSYVIPCTNLRACEKRIENQVSLLFLQPNGRTPRPNEQLAWLRTLRAVKPHPLVQRRPESAMIWELFHKALDQKVRIL